MRCVSTSTKEPLKVVVVAGGGESKVVRVAESRGECGGRTRRWPGRSSSSSSRWFLWPLTGPSPEAAAPRSSAARAETPAASSRRSRQTRLSRAREISRVTAIMLVSNSPIVATTSRRPAVVCVRSLHGKR